MGTRHVFIIDAIVAVIFNFPLKIFAADKMKIALCLAVLIAVAVSAPGTWDNFGKTLDRTVNDLIPKTEEERERDALNYAEEDGLRVGRGGHPLLRRRPPLLLLLLLLQRCDRR